MTNAPSATGFAHKATAFTMLVGASALFFVAVVWPVAAPFMTLEFEPAKAAESTVGDRLGEMADRFR